jgi:DNA modification methylase
MKFELHHGDCLDVLKTLADCSVDAIVTDPPYGLGKEPDPVKVMAAWILQGYFEVQGKGFMGKKWDAFVPPPIVWKEVFRVLKPGGHLLAFAGTRTQDWMAMSLRFAGFEIRDMIFWCYGQGFPKSLDVSKAIDKAAGAEREVVGRAIRPDGTTRETVGGRESTPFVASAVDGDAFITAPATEAAKQWEGWGTALKPALEPITLARKPPIGTIAANVLEHGTGGLNIDGCRVECRGESLRGGAADGSSANKVHEGWDRPWKNDPEARLAAKIRSNQNQDKAEQLGRFPANFIHDGSEQVLALFPETTSGMILPHHKQNCESTKYSYEGGYKEKSIVSHGDSGSAARFFYCAKASRDDRDEGCGALPLQVHQSGMGGAMPVDDDGNDRDRFKATSRNPHPTVKPTDLMRYLCRLITPPGGIVLDPFTGSGSTGKAAMAEGFRFIGIEREAEYIEIARARISAEADKPRQLSLF